MQNTKAAVAMTAVLVTALSGALLGVTLAEAQTTAQIEQKKAAVTKEAAEVANKASEVAEKKAGVEQKKAAVAEEATQPQTPETQAEVKTKQAEVAQQRIACWRKNENTEHRESRVERTCSESWRFLFPCMG